jgi:hypothetical protein
MRFGDIGVTVAQAKVEGFASTTSMGRLLAHDPELVVTLGLKNYNSNRVVQVGSQVDFARLEDDVGNTYVPFRARSDIDLPVDILGQIPAGKALRLSSDEKDEHDLLVFDRPVPGASNCKTRAQRDAFRSPGPNALGLQSLRPAVLAGQRPGLAGKQRQLGRRNQVSTLTEGRLARLSFLAGLREPRR